MSYQGKASALQQYGQVGAQSGVACATPHRLIQMLFDGALDKLALARGHMQRGEVALKGSHIGWVISIIDGLRMSLDKETGGEIAQNLDALYGYMQLRLLRANLHNDVEILSEVSTLLRTIKDGWDQIPDELRNTPHAVSEALAAVTEATR